jgi:glutamine---fructose-6-phosphate transaminase (isomerizing)
MPQLPRWAQRLKDAHPDAAMPTRDDPIPAWLEEEARRTPLWYIIREAPSARHEHPFLLHEEIHRQPGQWREILGGMRGQVRSVADAIRERGIRDVIFTGCGSAFFTAIHGAFTFGRIAPHLRATQIESYELVHYFPAVDPSTTLVVAHSGTGGSIETIQAVEAARERGCMTLALSNTEGSAVARAAERALTYVTRQACGPCISVISTRILIATMLALELAGESTGADGERSSLWAALERVADAGEQVLEQEGAIARLAQGFAGSESFFLVGSGPNYFSAREGTLKIEEQAILVGKAYRTGDFHHDALSVVGPGKPVFAIEAAGAANERVVDVLRAAREAGSPTVAVTYSGERGADELADVADEHLTVPGALPELIVPIPMTLVFQLVGYHMGVARGFNPDTLRTDHWPNARAWLTAFPLGTH